MIGKAEVVSILWSGVEEIKVQPCTRAGTTQGQLGLDPWNAPLGLPQTAEHVQATLRLQNSAYVVVSVGQIYSRR